MKLKVLTQHDVKQSVNMSQAINAVKEAYAQLSKGEAILPIRTQIPVKDQDGTALFMPAYLTSSQSLGAKIVSVFPKNITQNLPSIHALVIMIDAKTGQPEALIDGAYLTALRTGAGSGVATEILAKHNARVVAIFGAGTQGRTQLEAICTVRSVEKVWVYDREFEHAQLFVEEFQKKGAPFPTNILAAQSPSQAVKEADIICTATTSSCPVFEDQDLKPGVHINAIGSYTPEMQEIPAETVVRSKVFVDSISASMAEAGDLIIPLKKGLITPSHILGEIGLLATDQIKGRESNKDLTLFKSVGIALQDVAVANLALNKAKKLKQGIVIDL